MGLKSCKPRGRHCRLARKKIEIVMARSDELPIYREALEMMDRIMDYTDLVPRKYRFGVWQRILDLNVDVLTLTCRANRQRDKVGLITEMLDDLTIMKTLLRLCHRRQALSDKHMAHIAIPMVNVGRQASGWLKHFEQKSVKQSATGSADTPTRG